MNRIFDDIYSSSFYKTPKYKLSQLDTVELLLSRQHKEIYAYDVLRTRATLVEYNFENAEIFPVYARIDSLLELYSKRGIGSEYSQIRQIDLGLRKSNFFRSEFDYEEATNHLDSVFSILNSLDTIKDDFVTYYTIALIQKGQIAEALGRSSEAINVYHSIIDFKNKVAKINGERPSIFTIQGRIADAFMRIGEYDKAHSLSEKAWKGYQKEFAYNPEISKYNGRHIAKLISNLIVISHLRNDEENYKKWSKVYSNFSHKTVNHRIDLTILDRIENPNEQLKKASSIFQSLDNKDFIARMEVSNSIISLLISDLNCDSADSLLSNNLTLIDSLWNSNTIKLFANLDLLNEMKNLVINWSEFNKKCKDQGLEFYDRLDEKFSQFLLNNLIYKDKILTAQIYYDFLNIGIHESLVDMDLEKSWSLLERSKSVITKDMFSSLQLPGILSLDSVVFAEKQTNETRPIDPNTYLINFGKRGNNQFAMLLHNSVLSYNELHFPSLPTQFYNLEKNRSHNLYSSLIAPLNIPKKSTFTIIPDGELANIPFGALLTDPDDPNSFLEKDYTINYQLSATLMQQLEAKQVNTTGLAAFAPTFDDNPNELYASVRGAHLDDTISLYNLTHSADEVKYITDTWDAPSYTVTKDNVIDALKNKKIFHFAGHAVTYEEDSDYSFLALSSDVDNLDDKLLLKELYNLECNNEMVVLSACETGAGEIAKGEGVLSLARGFFYAGAKSVISTLWSVNDASSAIIMKEFYRQLRKGKRKDEALRLAKLHFLEHSDPEYHDPKYWAGFIAMGDMSPIFTPWWRSGWTYAGIGTLAIAGFLFSIRRRAKADS